MILPADISVADGKSSKILGFKVWDNDQGWTGGIIDDFKINLDKNLYTLETIKWSLIGEESVIQNANKIKQKSKIHINSLDLLKN